MNISSRLPFSRAFEYASRITSERFTNPLWKMVEQLNGAKFSRCIADVRKFGAELVTSAQSRRSKYTDTDRESSTKHTVLIDSFLDYMSSTQTVADAAVNFLSAGRDTTAFSMAWSVYFLLRDQHAQSKLLQSVRATFPKADKAQMLTLQFENLVGPYAFPYVQACFAEALRLRPVVPLELKETTRECMLPDGTSLPKGSAVVWIPFALAHSTCIWGECGPYYRARLSADLRRSSCRATRISVRPRAMA